MKIPTATFPKHRVGSYENLQNSFLSNNFVHVADAQVGVTVIYMGGIASR